MTSWILQANVDELQAAMKQGKTTALEICTVYLGQIAAHDKQGAKINAMLEINPNALFIAQALDAERKKKGPRGPLHGIPVVIKDNIDTGDKMHTSAGSIALANSFAQEDAFLVKKLRDAGAVILGKVNLSEWANFMAFNAPNGFSSRGGQVNNPYGPGKFDTGGSSSGTGAAIAAGFATLGIGTETSGSILSPSSSNSLVGIKSTVGLISRTGIIPISHSQDTAGPMTRTVKDSAILLGVIAGQDPGDPATLMGEGETDYTQFLDKDGLKGARIGVCKDPYWKWLNPGQMEIMERAISDLEAVGAQVVEVQIPTATEKWSYTVLFHEFKAGLNAYLSKLKSSPISSLADLIEYNKAHAKVALKNGQGILLEAEKTCGTLTSPQYLEARLKDLEMSQDKGIDVTMNEHQLDALLFPANFGAGIPAKAGYPSITVPGGYTSEGEPFGITLCGMAFSEANLIKLAYSYEQATQHRVEPTLLEV